MPTAKGDTEVLLNELLPFAKQMLREHREFFPFGGAMALDGTVTHEGATTDEERPRSKDLIQILREAHISASRAGTLRACAILYDMLIVPPGRNEKQDAIAMELDHRDNYSVVVVFPYSIDPSGTLHVEHPFALDGGSLIFASSP